MPNRETSLTLLTSFFLCTTGFYAYFAGRLWRLIQITSVRNLNRSVTCIICWTCEVFCSSPSWPLSPFLLEPLSKTAQLRWCNASIAWPGPAVGSWPWPCLIKALHKYSSRKCRHNLSCHQVTPWKEKRWMSWSRFITLEKSRHRHSFSSWASLNSRVLVKPKAHCITSTDKTLCGWIYLKFTHSSFLLTLLYLLSMVGEV